MFIALWLLSYSAPSGAACKLGATPHCAPPERGAHKNRKTINIVLLRSTSLRNEPEPIWRRTDNAAGLKRMD